MVLAYVDTNVSTGVTAAYIQTVLNNSGSWTFVTPAVQVSAQCNTFGAISIAALDSTHVAIACEDLQVPALNVLVAEVVSNGAPNIVSTLTQACKPLFDPTFYSTGTVSQSGFFVTGVGTNFPAAAIGGKITYSNGNTATVLGRYSGGTSLLVDTSYTVSAGASYELSYSNVYSPSTIYVGNTVGASAGTASQSGNTVTQVIGTNFPASGLVGATFTFLGGGYGSSTVMTRTSNTVITLSDSKTVPSGTPFIITYHSDTPDTVSIPGGSTVSQSTTTVTGVGTNFQSYHIGATLTFTSGGAPVTITAVTNTTHVTVSVSQTVASTTYTLSNPIMTVQASQTGNTITCANATFTAGMQGGIFSFTGGGGTSQRITAFVSATQLTIDGPSTSVAATSNWSITYGAPTLVDEGTLKVLPMSSTQAVVGYRDRGSTVYKQCFHVVDFVTNTSPPTVSAALTSQSTAVRTDVSAFSAINPSPFTMQKLTATKLVCLYPDNLSPSNRRYVIGTVTTGSPSTIALNTSQIWLAGVSPNGFMRATSTTMSNDGSTAVLAMFYTDQALDNQGNSTVTVLTADLTQSPPVLTASARQVWEQGNPNNNIGGCTLLATNQVVVMFQRSGEDNNGYTMVANFNPSNKTFSFQPFQLFNIWPTTGMSISCDTSTGNVYLFYSDGYSQEDSGHASWSSGLLSSETQFSVLDYKQVRGPRPIGILTNTITAQGQTGVVLLNGISKVQSGLLPGNVYYGHGDGSIQQVGRALDHTYTVIQLGLGLSHTDMLLKATAFG